MDIVALTAITSYYAAKVDPDAPQPAAQAEHHTRTAASSTSLAASLASNPFFHYCPAVRRYTDLAVNRAVPHNATTSNTTSSTTSLAGDSCGPAAASPPLLPPPALIVSLAHGIPLAFCAAHPRTRLAAESSPAGYRCGGLLVWHQPLMRTFSSPALCTDAFTRGGCAGRQWGRSSRSSSSSSSSSSTASSASSASSQTGRMRVIPPEPLSASSAATECQECNSTATTTATTAVAATLLSSVHATADRRVLPTMAKTVVVLHVYDRDEEALMDGDTVWHLIKPHIWWLERAVRPTCGGVAAQTDECERTVKHRAVDCLRRQQHDEDARDGVEEEASRKTCASAAQQQQQQPRLSCAIRLFLSPWAMPRRRPRLRCTTTTTTTTVSPQPSCRWCPMAVVELGLCGPHSRDAAVPFSSATFLAGLSANNNNNGGEAARGGHRHHHHRSHGDRRQWRSRRYHDTKRLALPAFGRFPTPHLSTASPLPGGRGSVATWRTAATADVRDREPRWLRRPLLELLGLEGVWGRAWVPCAPKNTVVGCRGFVAAPSPPLLPLHTLDLSFRTDLCSLESVLTTWAATGHLARLCRLSVMGCTQLRQLDWLANLPADTLEELNVCGCEELRDLRPVRRLSALRCLKATQLVQLQRLGWWWEAEGGEASRESCAVCCLDALAELDLACSSRRTAGLEDVEWVGTLSSLQRLALSVQEVLEEHGEEEGLRSGPRHGTRLAWLAACTALRELRLAFRDGASFATSQRPAPPAPPPLVTTHDVAHMSDLDILAVRPFPHLRLLEVVGARLTEHFTTWLAEGCTRLRELHVTSCRVSFSAAGLRQAQTAAVRAERNGASVYSQRRLGQPRTPPPLFFPTTHAAAEARDRATHSDDADEIAQRLKDEQWWFGQLSRLHRLRRLSIFQLAGCTDGSSLDWVAACVQLRHLAVRNCRWVLDAYAVHRLPQLRTLNLNATDIDDITFLRMRDGAMVPDGGDGGYRSRPTLSSSSATPASAPASPVAAVLRRFLSPTASPTTAAAATLPCQAQQQQQHLPSLSPAPTLCHLTELVLVDCPFLTDLTAIGYLTACRTFFASDHRVTNLDHLAPCRAMERLFLVNYTQLTDLTALRRLWRLQEVYITHSSVRDVAWVAQQQPAALPRLEVLTLAHSRLLGSVEALGVLPRLRHLDLRDCVGLNYLGSPAVTRPPPRATPPRTDVQSPPGGKDGAVLSAWALRGVHRAALALAGRATAAVKAVLPQTHRPTTTAIATTTTAAATTAPSAAPTSLAGLAPTLRFLCLSGCTSLAEAAVVGELAELQYLHAAFTGLRDVAWLRGCRSLKVLDLTMSPCCRPGAPTSAAAVALLTRLPEELPELEVMNRRPVERNMRS